MYCVTDQTVPKIKIFRSSLTFFQTSPNNNLWITQRSCWIRNSTERRSLNQNLTLLFKYRRKKSSRKDFPFLKAPATDSTTTALSLMSSCSSSSRSASSFRVNVWSGPVFTTWTPCGPLCSNGDGFSGAGAGFSVTGR